MDPPQAQDRRKDEDIACSAYALYFHQLSFPKGRYTLQRIKLITRQRQAITILWRPDCSISFQSQPILSYAVNFKGEELFIWNFH